MEPKDVTGSEEAPMHAGEQILSDVLQRIENRQLAAAGELSWDDHNQSYTEWSRQR